MRLFSFIQRFWLISHDKPLITLIVIANATGPTHITSIPAMVLILARLSSHLGLFVYNISGFDGDYWNQMEKLGYN